MRCFYNNVIGRLFEATRQLTSDRRVQISRLHTNQLALIEDPNVN